MNQQPQLKASAAKQNIDIIYIQELRYYHSELELEYIELGNKEKCLSVFAWEKQRQFVYLRFRNAAQFSCLRITK